MGEVGAGIDGGHDAERRVDARTVVALVVVLGDRLPVRVDHVVVRRRDEHPIDLPRCDELVQVADVLVQRRRVAGRVHEHPAVPLGDARGDQRVLALVEAGHVAEPGAPFKEPSSPYTHAWYGHLIARRLTLRAGLQQLVSPMPARVGEGVQPATLVADQQHALLPHPDRALITGLRQIVGSADAQPAGLEEMLLLPREDRRREVRSGGQRPTGPEGRRQHVSEQPGIDRRTGVGHGYGASSR